MRNETLPDSGAFILNLDDVDNPGSHWTSVYKDSYYDSFGLPCPLELRGRILRYNRVQHQDVNSSLCGLFSAAFIHLRNCGFSDYDINYRIFTRDDWLKNYRALSRISAAHLLR